MSLRNSITEVIDAIQTEGIRYSIHGEKGHSDIKHVCSYEEMKENLKEKRHKYDQYGEPIPESRFYSEYLSLECIVKTLRENIDAIEQWIQNGIDAKINIRKSDFELPTGEMISYGMDWNYPVPVHGCEIVLKRDPKRNPLLLFWIITAYPVGNIDDNDFWYEAMDVYFERKR